MWVRSGTQGDDLEQFPRSTLPRHASSIITPLFYPPSPFRPSLTLTTVGSTSSRSSAFALSMAISR